MKTKKSQVTLFIIAGLLILLFVSLTIYYRQVILKEPELLQPEYQPVKDYIQECIADLGADAINLLGSQSGYIEIPNEIKLEKSYVSLTPLALLKIPYWDYKSKSRIPSIDLMQRQISDYVIENIDLCLNDFQPFQKQFEINQQTDLKITTTIAEEEVIVEANQRIRVKNIAKDDLVYLQNYNAKIPVRLKQMYDLGRRILQEENRKLFLENITMDLMALNPEIPLNSAAKPKNGALAQSREKLKR